MSRRRRSVDGKRSYERLSRPGFGSCFSVFAGCRPPCGQARLVAGACADRSSDLWVQRPNVLAPAENVAWFVGGRGCRGMACRRVPALEGVDGSAVATKRGVHAVRGCCSCCLAINVGCWRPPSERLQMFAAGSVLALGVGRKPWTTGEAKACLDAQEVAFCAEKSRDSVLSSFKLPRFQNNPEITGLKEK